MIKASNLKFRSCEEFVKKYRFFDKIEISFLHKEIFKYYSLFVSENEFLLTALIQKPFSINKDIAKPREQFGSKVALNLSLLNELQNCSKEIVSRYNQHREIAILFIVNYNLLVKNNPNNLSELLSKKKATFLLDLLTNNYLE